MEVIMKFLVILLVVFTVNYCVVLGVVYVVAEIFNYSLPFWPTFFGIYLLRLIFTGMIPSQE